MKITLSKSDVQALESYQHLSNYCKDHLICKNCILFTKYDGCLFDAMSEHSKNICDFESPLGNLEYEVEN